MVTLERAPRASTGITADVFLRRRGRDPLKSLRPDEREIQRLSLGQLLFEIQTASEPLRRETHSRFSTGRLSATSVIDLARVWVGQKLTQTQRAAVESSSRRKVEAIRGIAVGRTWRAFVRVGMKTSGKFYRPHRWKNMSHLPKYVAHRSMQNFPVLVPHALHEHR